MESKDIEVISKLFEELNTDLQKHSKNFRVLIRETPQQDKNKTNPENKKYPTHTTSSLQLCHKFGIETYAEVATLQQSIKGFPCVLNVEEKEYSCKNEHDLRNALRALLSSSSFGWALMNALRN